MTHLANIASSFLFGPRLCAVAVSLRGMVYDPHLLRDATTALILVWDKLQSIKQESAFASEDQIPSALAELLSNSCVNAPFYAVV